MLGTVPRLLASAVVSYIPGLHQQEEEHWNYSRARVDKRLESTPSHPDLWSRIIGNDEGGTGSLPLEVHHANVCQPLICRIA
jgi:hypothetical protein